MAGSLGSTIHAANAALIAQGDVSAVEEFFAPDYVAHLTEQRIAGLAAVRGFVRTLRSAFPDVRVEIEILLEHADRIAWQRTLRGTHQGDYSGFPASGREIIWRDVVISRFQDGVIAEEWACSDLAERLLLARKRQAKPA